VKGSVYLFTKTPLFAQRLFVATGIMVCLCRYNRNASVRCLGNGLPMYALLCEHVYNCRLDMLHTSFYRSRFLAMDGHSEFRFSTARHNMILKVNSGHFPEQH
jgi:hypothetical protein